MHCPFAEASWKTDVVVVGIFVKLVVSKLVVLADANDTSKLTALANKTALMNDIVFSSHWSFC